MLFPFIGRLPAAGKRVAVSNDLGGLSDLFIAVRRDFRSVSAELLSALRDKALFTDVRPVVSPDAEWMSGPELESVKDKVSRLLQCLVGLDSKRLDSLSHGDLQTGNFVLDEKKELRVIDLDTMGLAPTYADGLSGLILRGANEAIMEAFTSKLGQEEVRPVDVVDIAFAIAKDLLWYGAAKKVNTNPFVHDQIARLLKGLTGAINFAASLPAPVIEK